MFKLSICIVALSSFYSTIAVFTCGTVSLEERNFEIYTSRLQNAKDESKKEQYNFYICYL